MSDAASPPAHPDVRLRLGRADDARGVLDISEAVAAEGRWIGREAPIDREVGLARYLASVDNQQALALLGVVGGPDGEEEIVGHLHLGVAPFGVAELGMLVAEQWRGRGVGNQLMQGALDWARAHPDVHKVALQVWPHNETALALYARWGFVREGYLVRHYRRRSGELWDAVVMGLPLD